MYAPIPPSAKQAAVLEIGKQALAPIMCGHVLLQSHWKQGKEQASLCDAQSA